MHKPFGRFTCKFWNTGNNTIKTVGTNTTYLDSIDDQEVLAATRNKMIALVKKYAKDAKGKPSGDYRNVSTAKDATELLEKIKEFVKGE